MILSFGYLVLRQVLLTPPQAPRANAYAERWVHIGPIGAGLLVAGGGVTLGCPTQPCPLWTSPLVRPSTPMRVSGRSWCWTYPGYEKGSRRKGDRGSSVALVCRANVVRDIRRDPPVGATAVCWRYRQPGLTDVDAASTRTSSRYLRAGLSPWGPTARVAVTVQSGRVAVGLVPFGPAGVRCCEHIVILMGGDGGAGCDCAAGAGIFFVGVSADYFTRF